MCMLSKINVTPHFVGFRGSQEKKLIYSVFPNVSLDFEIFFRPNIRLRTTYAFFSVRKIMCVGRYFL